MNRILALWFEQGTAADAANAINLHRARIKHVSPHWVKTQWANAQERGDLPPIVRPHNGFPPGPSSIVRRFQMVISGRAAA